MVQPPSRWVETRSISPTRRPSMLTRLATRVIPVTLAIALVLTSACGGDAPPTASPNAPGSAPSLREVAERGATSTARPSASTDGAAPGGASFSPLRRVNSFNYTFAIDFGSEGIPGGDFSGSITMEGAYVAPDAFSAKLEYDFPPIDGGPIPDMEMVGIGSDFYIRFGGDWQKDDLTALGIESLSPAQEEFYESFALKGLEGLPFDREDKNGVSTRHYVLETADVGRLVTERSSGFDAYFTLKAMQDATMEIWLAEDGLYAVAMVFDATLNPAEMAGAFGQQAREGSDFDMHMRMTYELFDFDDPDIHINAPEL